MEGTHLRLWQLSNGDIVGGAHNEYWQQYPPNHIVTSFESGENRVDDEFYGSGWDVYGDEVWLNNKSPPLEPATVIEKR